MLPIEDKEFCRNFIYIVNWQAAKSIKYKSAPHEYTVRSWNPDKESEFEAFVLLIRKYGYQEKFNKSTYTYLEIDGKKYWTMGMSLYMTILINRAEVKED